MSLNETNLTYPRPDVDSFQGLFEHANEVTDSGFAPGILLAVFVIVFITMKQYESSVAFATASWVTAISSILMYFGGFLPEQFLILTVILLLVGFILAGKSKGANI